MVISKGLFLIRAKNAGTKVIDSTGWREEGKGGRQEEGGKWVLNRSDLQVAVELSITKGQASSLTRCALSNVTVKLRCH